MSHSGYYKVISHALSVISIGESSDKVLVPDEFMNCKKAHEVQAMSEVVASLAECCRVKQVSFLMFKM